MLVACSVRQREQEGPQLGLPKGPMEVVQMHEDVVLDRIHMS